MVARHPLTVFFSVVVAAAALLSAGLSLERADDLQPAVAGLTALFCCWALGERDKGGSRLFARLGLTLAVSALAIALYALGLRLFWSDTGSAPGPLLDAVRPDGSNYTTWLQALASGLVVAAALSPTDTVRRLARSLLRWPATARSPLLVALAAPALLALGAMTATRIAPPESSGVPLMLHLSVASLVVGLLSNLVFFAPAAFAWYGFASERLLRRTSPLMCGLLIGATTGLLWPLSELSAALRSQFWPRGWAGDLTLDVAYPLALALIAVWLVSRTRGGLLPVLFFLAAMQAGSQAAYWWGGSSPEASMRAGDVYAWLVVALALLLVFTGRMWRRQPKVTRLEQASPSPGSPLPEPL
jgi:hypothetical protein